MSSEYGWTDEQIGDIPLSRLRQITAAIQLRRYEAIRQENSRFSWLARQISGFVAAGYMIGEGEENKALDVAQQLAYDDVERALLGAPAVVPQGQNAEGSFEKLMMFAKRAESPHR